MFRYEHPEHLWLLAAVPLLLLLTAAYWYWRKKAVARLGDVERVMPAFSGTRFWLKAALFAAGLILLALAWSNPQLGARKQTVTQQASDIIIALDISNSMLCQDVAPSRLELAKVFAQKLVQSLEGERIGLIFFAGNAYLQMPLSTDYSFILQSIQTAAPDLITEQGTAIPAALELAGESFGYEPGGGRAIILITDGESHDENATKAADKAYDEGIVVFAVGAGTLGGGPIPTGDYGENQYKRDDKGEIVRTHLDEALLSKTALAGGGQAFNISQGDAVVSAIRREVDGLQKRELEIRSYAEFESWYQWFLLPALLLLLLEALVSYRKKKSAGLAGLLALVAFIPFNTLSAQSTHKLLRQGDEAYDLEHYKEAEKKYRDAADKNFNDPVSQYNLGNSLYEQGNWPDAATRFGQAARSATNPGLKADALHNLGNAQLKQQKYKEAVDAYQNSLRLRPGDAGTRQNLQMAKKKLKEEQQEQQKQQEQEQKQEQEQQKQQEQQQDNQDQQNNQPNQQQEQQKQEQQQQQQSPQQQEQQQRKLKEEEARRLLETAIGPEDQKNARKYREQRRQPRPSGREKDW